MTAPFFDQVVLLTGASSGIGEQIAYQLAEQGARLMLTARRADRLAAVAQVCQSRGAQATFLAVDLTDPAAAERLVNETVQHYGRLDMLLYNAGGGHPGRFDALPNLESIQTEIALNYLGLVACVHHALPHLKQTRGRLVAVASFGGLMALSGSAGYNAAKHALRGFLNTLRVELRGTGISVTVIYPGAVRTEQLEATLGDKLNTIPTMSPERCAQLVLLSAARRERQRILTLAGRVLALLYAVMPGLVDRLLAGIGSLYTR